MFDWFYKALPINSFFVLLVKILRLEKKQVISAPLRFSLLFQKKILLIKRAIGGREGSGNNKRGS